MGMFSTRYNSYNESANLLNDDNIVAEACYEDNMTTAALRVVAESEYNWNQIMQSVAIGELAAYEETGDADNLYVTEAAGGIFATIKAFFKKLLEKIKGIFSKFISIIDSWSKDDKAFVSKYRAELFKRNLTDFEYDGYTFTIDSGFMGEATKDVSSSTVTDLLTIEGAGTGIVKELLDAKETPDSSNDETSINTAVKAFRGDKLEEAMDKYRANVIKKCIKTESKYNSDKCDASDFTKDLTEALRNGESSKETLDNIDVADVIKTITDTSDLKKKAQHGYEGLNKAINECYKKCDRAEKAVSSGLKEKKDTEAKIHGAWASGLGAAMGVYQHMMSINTSAYGVVLQALKDQNRQAKAICVKMLSYKPKNESTSYYEEGSSLLAGVRMI